MVRGTTTQFRFKLPRKSSELESVKIVFWQDGYSGPSADRPLPIIKTLKQCSVLNSEYELNITLSQEETLRFSDDRKGYVQLHALAIDGLAYSHKKREITVYPLEDDSILGDVVIPTPQPDGVVILDGGIIGG